MKFLKCGVGEKSAIGIFQQNNTFNVNFGFNFEPTPTKANLISVKNQTCKAVRYLAF